ncbi:MAG: carbon monoxide dehydrogenase subunit G [Rhodospirillaceae bacterium]|nr:carbon monoxide dehydrogenase subunit G [Rhodospirillaceae bacterium]
MRGEYQIAAGREAVWAALNDPSILQACLEGCESFDKISDTDFKAKMTTKVGPIRTKFACTIQLSDLDPPNAYTLSGKGDGGASGFAKGTVKVSLTESDGATVLGYTVDASLRGKIGQMGARVVDNVARSMADKFFGKLSARVEDEPAGGASGTESAAETEPSTEKKGFSLVHIILIAAVIALAGAAYYISNW